MAMNPTHCILHCSHDDSLLAVGCLAGSPYMFYEPTDLFSASNKFRIRFHKQRGDFVVCQAPVGAGLLLAVSERCTLAYEGAILALSFHSLSHIHTHALSISLYHRPSSEKGRGPTAVGAFCGACTPVWMPSLPTRSSLTKENTRGYPL